VEDVNIYEYSYSSKNKRHPWKKREVGLFLLGNFAEDISMYRLRNMDYDFRNLLENVLRIDLNGAFLKTLIKGRMLWTFSEIS